MASTDYDLFVVGGGINGCGIARDAAGRGVRVGLAEMHDLGGATSSASTKLFHGGLRYLEYLEVRLVRESLIEREVLLRMMPHISWPMRFVLPFHKDMRFEGTTTVSKILSFVLPWMKGRRPAWLIRLGLFAYDNLGGRKILPATKTLDLKTAPEGQGLDGRFEKAFEYSDCWVEDSRLVVLNARDAQARGADILVRTKLVSADRTGDHWVLHLEGPDGAFSKTAKVLVNAAGPWVEDVVRQKLGRNSTESVRLVRGSHIVVDRLFDHDKCYFFQGEDGRIIFAIPYETDYTLIGTTDAEHSDPATKPVCTDAERDYLLDFINPYLAQDIGVDDIRWTYSGVRPLYDDGASSASAATRDYVLSLDTEGAPVMSVFGGKITTYRKLAEHALRDLDDHLVMTKPWTAGSSMPGGDFEVQQVPDLEAKLKTDFAFLSDRWAKRMIKGYGTEAWDILHGAAAPSDLGQDFGATLTAREVAWLMDREFARTAEDVLWRRSKLGLKFDHQSTQALEAFMAARQAG